MRMDGSLAKVYAQLQVLLEDVAALNIESG
jgi:hypothetical protein